MKINCLLCGKLKEVRPAHVRVGWGKYCSHACSAKVTKNFTGHQHTEESKLKMKLKKIGVPSTSSTKFKPGKESPKWKGGITPENKKLRDIFRSLFKMRILKRDNFTCQICKIRGGKLQVDHIKDWASHPNLRFENSNCRTVCMSCHYEITFGRIMPKRITTWGTVR